MLNVLRNTEVVAMGDHLCFFLPTVSPSVLLAGVEGSNIRDGGPGQASEVKGLMLGTVGQCGRLICVEP